MPMLSRTAASVAALLVSALVSGPTAAQLPPPYRFAIESPNPGPEPTTFGNAVADAGDVDGDGVSDLLIGASFEAGQFGRAYVFSGDDGALVHTLVSPNPSVFFGCSVAGVGDVDADGVPDLLVGEFPEDGRLAHVFSGVDGVLLHTLTSPDPGSGSGCSVSGVGDVEGDAVPDFLVGEQSGGDGPSFPGRAYVFSGASGSVLLTLESPNPQNDGRFGVAVAGLGDVDGDTVPDLAVGAPEEDGGDEHAGRAYVFSGATGTRLHTLRSPDPDFWGFFGYTVAGLGDVDTDAVPDLVVGAYGEDGSAGLAHVFSGATGALVHTLSSLYPANDGFFGTALARVSDVDADGVPEIVVGAPGEGRGGNKTRDGRVYIFSGAIGAALYNDVSPMPENGGSFGISVAAIADVGGGVPGLLIGSDEDDGEGRIYLAASPFPVASEPPPAPAAAVTVWPNPFRARATFGFTLAEGAPVTLALYDVLGREVARLVEGRLSAGRHAVVLDASGWVSGVYGWRLVSGSRVEAGRVTRVR